MSTNFEDLILRDTNANRPAAGIPGRLFYNTTSEKLQRDTGAAWEDCEPAAGGGGDSTHTAAYGSRPSAGNAGDLFLPSDGAVLERDTGAAWVPWGPLFPLTKPVDGDFAWINQGGASVTDEKGGLFLSAPAGSGTNLRIRKKSAPSAPYTITAAFLPAIASVDYASFGLVFRQSSDGKLATFQIQHNSALTASNTYGIAYRSLKWTDPTTFSASYGLDLDAPFMGLIWMRIADNNTNRICSISHDGQHWIALHSIGRTDFLTANEVGFFVESNNASYAAGAFLISWAQG